MLPRRLLVRRPLLPARLAARTAIQAASRPAFAQLRRASDARTDPDVADPGMNGGYVNPPAIKRQHRDPYADWWDKQERRNFGEPVHEDNDILGVFSPEDYTHAKPGTAFLHLGFFVAAVLGLCGVVSQIYPDKPAAPRTFPDGLEAELGGKEAVMAMRHGGGDI